MERQTPVGMMRNQRRSKPEVLRLSFMPFSPNSFSKRKLPQGCKSVLIQVLLSYTANLLMFEVDSYYLRNEQLHQSNNYGLLLLSMPHPDPLIPYIFHLANLHLNPPFLSPSFPIRVERIGGHFFQDHVSTRGRDKAEEVFQSSEIGGLHVLSENALPCGSFVRNGKSFLEGILLYLLIAPTEIPRQYSQFWELKPPY
jgi:hypothetical protein